MVYSSGINILNLLIVHAWDKSSNIIGVILLQKPFIEMLLDMKKQVILKFVYSI